MTAINLLRGSSASWKTALRVLRCHPVVVRRLLKLVMIAQRIRPQVLKISCNDTLQTSSLDCLEFPFLAAHQNKSEHKAGEVWRDCFHCRFTLMANPSYHFALQPRTRWR
jgi:hypothetical protein